MQKTKKQRNNHARSKKRKSKILAKLKHIFLMGMHAERKSMPLGEIAARIKESSKIITATDATKVRSILKGKANPNQRQKRKLWRQSPYARKKAA